ncbi:MAG: hypothetical protein IGS38_15815 [Synechococcales cyanobacterium M58_A2018_015]|nr:hypothetical protein [Synechococcales cyanobacterium M58_A2018_015]
MTTVSLQTIAALFGSEEKLIAPVITQSSDDGTSILSFVLTAEGEIPEDGLIVTVNSDIQVGNDGLYNWDVTSLIQRWAVDPTNNDGVAISGFYGNVDIDGRNSYGIFHTVGSTTGQVPILTIKTLGGGSSSPRTLYGTSASETLAGGQANDTIYGNGGEDFLNGRGQ